MAWITNPRQRGIGADQIASHFVPRGRNDAPMKLLVFICVNLRTSVDN